MTDKRMITLECLLAHLEAVLGSDDLLFRRFERGLRQADERCLTDAMNTLSLYPLTTRQVVEDIVMCWLFGMHERAEWVPRGVSPRA